MPDILISNDIASYNKAIAAIESMGSTLIQTVINEYGNLDIAVLTPDDLGNLFKSPSDLIFDKMTGGSVMIGGIAVDRDKAKELLSKPTGYDAFIQLVSETNTILKERAYPRNFPIQPHSIESYFELNEENEIVFKQTMKDKIAASFKRYATSDTAKKVLEFAQAVVAKHTELNLGKLTAHSGEGVNGLIKEIIAFTWGTETIAINEKAIEEYNRR